MTIRSTTSIDLYRKPSRFRQFLINCKLSKLQYNYVNHFTAIVSRLKYVNVYVAGLGLPQSHIDIDIEIRGPDNMAYLFWRKYFYKFWSKFWFKIDNFLNIKFILQPNLIENKRFLSLAYFEDCEWNATGDIDRRISNIEYSYFVYTKQTKAANIKVLKMCREIILEYLSKDIE